MNSVLKQYLARLLGAPLALAGGWVGTQVVSHVNVVGTIGLGKSDIAHAVVAVGTFLAGAAATYLSHHKGLDHWIGKVGGIIGNVGLATSSVAEQVEPPPLAGVKADVPLGG